MNRHRNLDWNPGLLPTSEQPVDIFWSELGFFYKRRVKAWSLFYGVPLCAYVSYNWFNSLHTSVGFMHLSGHLYASRMEFYSDNGFMMLAWLLCMSLTVSKFIATLWPTEIETGTSIPKLTGSDDPTVWPPRPKPSK